MLNITSNQGHVIPPPANWQKMIDQKRTNVNLIIPSVDDVWGSGSSHSVVLHVLGEQGGALQSGEGVHAPEVTLPGMHHT